MLLGFIQRSNASSRFIHLGGNCGCQLRFVRLHVQKARQVDLDTSWLHMRLMCATPADLLFSGLVLEEGWKAFEIVWVLEDALYLMNSSSVRVKDLCSLCS